MSLTVEDRLLSGVPIGAGPVAHCDVCGVCLRPEHEIELLVTITGAQIDVATTRCRSCARGSLASGTERPCLLVAGRVGVCLLASGRSQLIVCGAVVIDRSG